MAMCRSGRQVSNNLTVERSKVKLKIAVILGLALLSIPAHAGLFDFLSFPFGPRPLFSQGEQAQIVKSMISEVPVREDCAPTFIAGDDGIFRRTEYCHRVNPSLPIGFLNRGFDVPAEFLKGFTEADVLARWKDVKFQVPEFLGSKVEVPAEVFTLLNVKAAQAWQMMLDCTKGDADDAREMYRTGVFDCSEAALIRERLVDIRTSLPMLAASVEVAPFMDGERIEQKSREIEEKKREIFRTYSREKNEQSYREYGSLQRQEEDIRDLRFRLRMPGANLVSLLERYVPKMPRIHPLFAQVLFEEILSLMGPEESSRSVANRINRDRGIQIYLIQLSLWGNSIKDRDCSSFGLWPSANRVALEALADKTTEVMTYLGGPDAKLVRYFMVVGCPSRQSVSSDPFGFGRYAGVTAEDTRKVMRLHDVYKEGRFRVWRELREVRERYLTQAKK
jgi:hypothetical protein